MEAEKIIRSFSAKDGWLQRVLRMWEDGKTLDDLLELINSLWTRRILKKFFKGDKYIDEITMTKVLE